MQKNLIYLNFLVPLLAFLIPQKQYTLGIISGTLVIPIALFILNLTLFLMKVETSILRCCIYMLGGLSFPMLVDYFWLAARTRAIPNLDAESTFLSKSIFIHHLAITFVLFVVLQVIRKIQYKI